MKIPGNEKGEILPDRRNKNEENANPEFILLSCFYNKANQMKQTLLKYWIYKDPFPE